MTERKKTERASITPNERLQLIGLVTLAQQYDAALQATEASMLAITLEWDDRENRLHRPWEGGHTNDAVLATGRPERIVDELLWKLGLKVGDEAPSIVPAALSIVEQLARFTDPRKSSEPSDELDTFARMIGDAKSIVGNNAPEDA